MMLKLKSSKVIALQNGKSLLYGDLCVSSTLVDSPFITKAQRWLYNGDVLVILLVCVGTLMLESV